MSTTNKSIAKVAQTRPPAPMRTARNLPRPVPWAVSQAQKHTGQVVTNELAVQEGATILEGSAAVATAHMHDITDQAFVYTTVTTINRAEAVANPTARAYVEDWEVARQGALKQHLGEILDTGVHQVTDTIRAPLRWEKDERGFWRRVFNV